MIKIFAALLIFLAACSNQKENKYTSTLQVADSVVIGFKFADRISAVHKKDRNILAAINKVLSKPEVSCSCEPTGYMLVYVKDSVRLDLDFATVSGGSETGCEFAIVKENDVKKCYRLTYDLGMYLDELRNFIKP